MAISNNPTVPPRLLVVLGACLVALAVFAGIEGTAGAALKLGGGLCGLAGLVWFLRARRR